MKEKYIEDLREIKDIMNRSSRFISLSGISGVMVGITALIGAFLAYWLVFKDNGYLSYLKVDLPGRDFTNLLFIAFGTVVLAFSQVIYFTVRKARQQNQKIWDHQAKRILISLAIPLLTGGILCLMMLSRDFVGVILPLTLIFYGLALVNTSKYTLGEIRSLGLLEILLGLLAFQFIEVSLAIWLLGFGVLHIAYGVYVHLKYK